MTSTCERLTNIEALLDAGQSIPATDTYWMVQQMRGWQKWAKQIVDYGDVIGRLRTCEVSPAQAAIDILDGYEQLFKVK